MRGYIYPFGLPSILGAVPTSAGGGWQDDGAVVRLVNTADDVHIGGTAAPGAKLKVTGNVIVTGTSTLTGAIGSGIAPSAARWLNIVASTSGSANQYGAFVNPTVSSEATATATAIYGKVTTAAASFTATSVAALKAADATKGAGSTITTQYGLYVESLTSGGTNWAIYTAGSTASYFGGAVGVATTSPSTTNGGIDIASGGLALILGAVGNSSARTDDTAKVARVGCYHRDNEEEPLGVIVAESTSTTGRVILGGGTAQLNAATQIEIYTAANNATPTGTERLRITSSGDIAQAATSKHYLDGVAGTGDTYITESSANVLDLYAGGAKQLSLTATTATVAGNLIVSGAGPHAIGGAALNYIQTLLTGSFTSGGASVFANLFRVAGTLTGATGDTTALNAGEFTPGGIITAGAAEVYTLVSTLRVSEPNITVGAGDSILTAATVYIANAPTEGASNYALFVDAGASRFDGSVLCQDALTTNSATAGLGYSTGAGGAVEQATSRTTGVTLNKVCGAITLVSAAGSTTPASFTVTNSTVAATDVIRLSQKSGTDKYILAVTAVGSGSFEITFYTTGGTTTEQPVFNFAVMKAVAA